MLEEVSLCLAAKDAASPSEKLDQIRRFVELVGLTAALDASTSSLSGGQKQLLNLASCLAAGANLILLDEITSMLDPGSRASVLQAVLQIHRAGTAIVWITHRPEELGYAERVLVLEEGKLAFEGGSRDFFYGHGGSGPGGQSPCEQLGMELPYTVQVVKQLERKGYSLPGRPVHPQELSQAVKQRCLF